MSCFHSSAKALKMAAKLLQHFAAIVVPIMEQWMTKQPWTLGLDVIVTDSTSECYGQVGHIVRISSPGNTVRVSVNFDGDVFGFDQDDIDVVMI